MYVSENRESLGISSFGLSLTTMEEVFMKVGSGSTETAETRYTIRTVKELNLEKLVEEKILVIYIYVLLNRNTSKNS